MHVGGRRVQTRAVVARESAASLSIDALSFDCNMAHDAVGPTGKLCLCSVHEGGVERRYLPDGAGGRFGAGDVLMDAPHARVYRGVIRQVATDSIMFDPQLLARVAAEDPTQDPTDPSKGLTRERASVRLAQDLHISPVAAGELRRGIAHVRDVVLANPLTRSAPLVASSAEQLLAAGVLAAFPLTSAGERRPFTDRAAGTAAVRRPVAYIEDHAGEPFALADIAAAAGVSGRAGFRRGYDVTPMAYVRLDAVHRDLLAADPADGTTVADLGRRWGSAPTSTFTSFHRHAYGAPPSATQLRG